MLTEALCWQTDADLEITILSPELRTLAGIRDATFHRIHLSDVWEHGGPYGPTVREHRRALAGHATSLRAHKAGKEYRLDLLPLHDTDGSVVGVIGRATELNQH